LLQLRDGRRRISLKRGLARDVGLQRGFEAVQLGQAASHGIAPRPRRRQPVRQVVSRVPRGGECVAAFGKQLVRDLLRLLRLGHRPLDRLDVGLGGASVSAGRLCRALRLNPARVQQLGFHGADLIGELAIALCGPRLAPQLHRALLLLG